MIICVATGKKADITAALPDCDLAVFGFSGLGEVDYESELKGVTDKFEAAAKLSKSRGCAVICGCKTRSRGMLRKSAAVAEKGRLLGISDMTYVLDGEQFKSGASLGLYTLQGCKVGVCIENDLLFPDAAKSLASCGCNVIIAIAEQVRDVIPPLIIRAYSYLFGVPIVLCAGNAAYFSEVNGAIAGSTRGISMFEVNPQNRYHVVTTRQRGLFSEPRADY